MKFFNLPSRGLPSCQIVTANWGGRSRLALRPPAISVGASSTTPVQYYQSCHLEFTLIPPASRPPNTAIPTIEHADDGVTAQANKPPRNRLLRLQPRASRFTQSSPPSGQGGRVDLLPRNS